MKQSIWDKVNYYTNSSVGIDGFILMQNEYFMKYNDYISNLPEFPKSEEEASFATFKLREQYHALKTYESILEILICTSIESLVNAAGIHACTEKFYKTNIERNDILGKIRLLILIVHGVEISEDNSVIKLIKVMFDRRNSLVHPKSKHYNIKTNLPNIATDCFDTDNKTIIKLLSDFDKVLKFFVQYDLIPKSHFELYQENKYIII